MVKPRKGKRVRVMPPPDASIRVPVEAVVTDVTRDWVLADVPQSSWRFRAGTGLLLRRAALLEVDRQLIAPDGAVVQVYPPETRNPRYAAMLMDQILGGGRRLGGGAPSGDTDT